MKQDVKKPAIPFYGRAFLETFERAKKGTLAITLPDGETRHYKGSEDGPIADMTIHNWACVPQIAMRGDIGLGETYASGMWESSDVSSFIAYCLQNINEMEGYAHGGWLQRLGFVMYNTFLKANTKKGSAQNIRAHYDVGNDFYKLWLDKTMTYSSALRASPHEDLESAQKNKYQRILDKLGDAHKKILEIGCGWGGFAEQAMRMGREVTGITISKQQHDFAARRVGNNANIQLLDYRNLKEKFDAIVSIEMFEAVGERYWPDYFRTLKNSLATHGRALVQTIVIDDKLFDGYRQRSDYIRHYIFPGGMLPSLARFKEEATKAGLIIKDIHAFGHDYAWTLRQWLTRFKNAESEMYKMGYDQSFLRSWRFYMGMCIGAFDVGRTNVVQVELAHA
ncbi:MAG: cyclopropane-fatty-acyl-phospholipid synthase family protein [Alphaproteobacteria bacterium]|nr:cyclopropane-fatty-acyl-phospholipid synthase family protein [Alphaproteobacteria bacterium]